MKLNTLWQLLNIIVACAICFALGVGGGIDYAKQKIVPAKAARLGYFIAQDQLVRMRTAAYQKAYAERAEREVSAIFDTKLAKAR